MLDQQKNTVYMKMLADIFSPIYDEITNNSSVIDFPAILSARFPIRNDDIEITMWGSIILDASIAGPPKIFSQIVTNKNKEERRSAKRYFYITKNIQNLSEEQRFSLINQLAEIYYHNNFGDIYPYEAFVVYLLQLLADNYHNVVINAFAGNISAIGGWEIIDLSEYLIPPAIHFPNVKITSSLFNSALSDLKEEIDGYMLFPDIVDRDSRHYTVIFTSNNNLRMIFDTTHLITTRIAWSKKGLLKNNIPRVYRSEEGLYDKAFYSFSFRNKDHVEITDRHELVGEPIIVENITTSGKAIEFYKEKVREIARNHNQRFQAFIDDITNGKERNAFFTSLLTKNLASQ